MTVLTCGSLDCKHNGNKYRCDLKKVTMNEAYYHTVNQGLQHFWQCKQYEKSEETKAFEEQFKKLMKGE